MNTSEARTRPRLPKTVLQVSNNHFVAGGSDRYYLELSKALRSSGIEVIPFAPSDPRNESTEWSDYFPRAAVVEQAGISDAFRFVYSTDAKESLVRLLKEKKIQLAHCHIYYGRVTASILPVLQKAGIPVVQTLHEYKLICPVYTCLRHGAICEACHGRHFWKAALYRCNRESFVRSLASATESYVSKSLGAHSKLNHLIAVSEFQRGRMIANNICKPADITTIHNFVDADRYSAASGAGSYVCYFGRIEKLKGIETLVNAMRRIPNVQLKIVGDGDYRQQCERLIVENGNRNVEVIDFQSGDKLANLVRGSLCTVLPSEWYENCPMSVLESFAYGRPVIGTNIGGIPELINDGHDGYIVPVGDPEALAAAIDRLASDHELAISMGCVGRQKVEQKFNREVHLNRVRAVYEQVLSG